jgi:hypothetical protein
MVQLGTVQSLHHLLQLVQSRHDQSSCLDFDLRLSLALIVVQVEVMLTVVTIVVAIELEVMVVYRKKSSKLRDVS